MDNNNNPGDLNQRGLWRLSLTVIVGLTLCTPGFLTAQPMSDHTYSSETIARGASVYVRQCALCHGPDGSWVPDVNLARGVFRSAVTDRDLRRVIREGTAQGRMPAIALDVRDMEGIIAYIRTGFDPDGATIVIGNPERGRELFRGKAQCRGCHRVNGRGPRGGPDLSDIGVLRTPAMLQRTLVDPANAVLPINRPVTIVTQSGETVRGRRLNEDTYTVQVIDQSERLRSFEKSTLKSYEISMTPTHKPSTLAPSEIADVLGYLLSLRGI